MTGQVALSPALARVARGDLCAGCGACAALAPGKVTMREQPPGWARPVQGAALSAQEDRAIAEVCPGLGQSVAADGRRDDPLWGPFVEMVTGWAGNPALRHAGASGGTLSALTAHLLASGEVDAVVTNGPDPDRPTGNRTLVLRPGDDPAVAAGSRYAPSSPLAGLPALVASGRRHAFIGKPCDAAALRAMTGRDAAVAAAFPVILSFFCAGVPSATGARAVLARLGVAEGEVSAFRYRGNGWPGMATARLSDGTERSMTYAESWGSVLSRHVQHRCKICADGTGVAADIACADAWEVDSRGYPLFEEADGVSLMVARTPLGQRILAEARASGQLESGPFDLASLTAIQVGQRDRRRALLARLAALRLVGRPVPHYRGLRLVDAARQNSLRSSLINFLGTLRRAILPRRKGL